MAASAIPAAQLAPPQDRKPYLEQRSDIAKRLREKVSLKRITIIDDQAFDADVVGGVLRRCLGHDVRIDSARSMVMLHTLWQEGLPDLVILDDRLGHMGTALTHMPALARFGYMGPVVVMSGLMTRARRAEVMKAGAAAVIHKDDLDTLTVMELLLCLLDTGVLPERKA